MTTDQRVDRLLGLLSAARTVIVANAEETSRPMHSGAVALLDELERAIHDLAEDLRTDREG